MANEFLQLMTFDEAMAKSEAQGEMWMKRVNESLERNPFLEEAKKDERCSFIITNGGTDKDLHIIVKTDRPWSDYIGFYIGLMYPDNTFSVWCAWKRYNRNRTEYEIADGMGVREYEYKEGMTLDWLIKDLEDRIDTCPECGKKVGRENMEHYFFAGRCCGECLPKMKEKYETKGWYN